MTRAEAEATLLALAVFDPLDAPNVLEQSSAFGFREFPRVAVAVFDLYDLGLAHGLWETHSYMVARGRMGPRAAAEELIRLADALPAGVVTAADARWAMDWHRHAEAEARNGGIS